MTTQTFHDPSGQPGPLDIARMPLPGLAMPGKVALTSSGDALLMLASTRGDMTYSLLRQPLDGGEATILLDAAANEAPREAESIEEALRIERARQRSGGISTFQRLPDSPWLIVTIRRNLSLVHEDSGERRDLTQGDAPCLDPKPTPDGQRVVFLREGELWSVPVDGGAPRQLTDGPEGTTRGAADFVAQEEMHRSSGYFISPKGGHIALFEVDERHIPEYPIVHQGKDEVVVETHRYPFAGAANPKVQLALMAADGGELRPLELASRSEEEVYIPRVGWFDEEHLMVQLQNRDQTWLELLSIEVATGAATVVTREETQSWINLHDEFRAIDEGRRALWLSERSGFQHLTLLDRETGEATPLTSGDWEVNQVLAVDEEAKRVYISGTKPSALERQVFALSYEGELGALERITEEPGVHSAQVDLDSGWLIDLWQDLETPPRLVLRPLNGEGEARLIARGEDGDERVAGLTPPEPIEVFGPSGDLLHGVLFKAKTGEGPRPLLVHVYGGPGAQRVHNAWTTTVDMRAHYWTRLGFHVLRLDNRGSKHRGLAFESALRYETGRVEMEDQVRAVEQLVEAGLVDPARVGMVGWSYGGYMACMALIRAPETFKAAVSGAPVTHWDGYDTHYTERYMGQPKDNAEGYEESSVLAHAADMKGELLLIHGLLDENVHFRHSARLINALVKADKDFELLVLPDERHMPRDEATRLYMERRIARFFERVFQPGS